MTATVFEVRASLFRSATLLAFEVRARVRVEARLPAVAAVTTRLALAPARMFAGLTRLSLPFEEVATTSRLSW